MLWRLKLSFLGLFLVLILGVSAKAATIVVDKGGAGNYTTITEAINASSAGDTIEIRGGTYEEQVNLQGKTERTLQTAPGADVVIQSSDMPLWVSDTLNIVIRGTDGHPLVLRRTTANMLVEGGNQYGDLTFAYVQFDGNVGTVAVTTGGVNPDSTITFDHCQFTCQAEVCGLVTWDQANIVLNDCLFAMTGNANAVRSTTCLPGRIEANRCTFNGDKTSEDFIQIVDTAALQFGDPWGVHRWHEMAQEIVATDCVFNGFAWAYEQWDGDLPDNTYGDRKTVRIINPSAGNANESAQIGWAKLWCGENVYIEGKSPQNKSDFRNSTTLIHGVDVRDGGRVWIKDVILKGSAFADPPHSTVNIAPYSDHDSTVTIERCYLSAENNNFIGANDIIKEGSSLGKSVINLDNCIVKYGDGLFKLNGPNSTKLNLAHCTFFNVPGTANATMIMTGGGTDEITSSYSIFSSDDASNKFITAGVGFTGTLNLLNHPAQGVTGSVPADTMTGDPLLDGTGHLTNDSLLALNKAVGSTMALDYDGDTRPLGHASASDLGADEIEGPVNAVRSWSLY